LSGRLREEWQIRLERQRAKPGLLTLWVQRIFKHLKINENF
jgi:hypothetical protein